MSESDDNADLERRYRLANLGIADEDDHTEAESEAFAKFLRYRTPDPNTALAVAFVAAKKAERKRGG